MVVIKGIVRGVVRLMVRNCSCSWICLVCDVFPRSDLFTKSQFHNYLILGSSLTTSRNAYQRHIGVCIRDNMQSCLIPIEAEPPTSTTFHYEASGRETGEVRTE